MTTDRKILIGLVAVLLLAPQYDGWGGLTDRLATYKNNGYPASEARCAVLLTGQASAKEIKK